MVRMAPMPRPTRQGPHQAQNESNVVEHSSTKKSSIVFGSVTVHMLTLRLKA